MYPTSLTQLARANPFSAPLFSLQKVEETPQSLQQPRARRLAAAAVADGKPRAEAAQQPSAATTFTKFSPVDELVL